MAQLAQAIHGAKVIAITRFHKSPLTQVYRRDPPLSNRYPSRGGSSSADISPELPVRSGCIPSIPQKLGEVWSEINRRTSQSVLNKLY